jgi:lactate dehydrogenase-like 2-hydroxyacid dehydrogenase
MKITILSPKSEFSPEQQKKLELLGEVVYTTSRKEYEMNELLELVKNTDILAPDPDNVGGFEKAKPRLTQLLESLPNIKGVALATTSFGWIDLEYCKKRNIPVANIPGYSREAVAEHTLCLLLSLAKRILVTDRRTQKGQYKIGMGFELKGKTLGIIGIGNIGSRVAELGQGIGMNVIAYNKSPKEVNGVKMVSLDEVLKLSDAIAIHTTHLVENDGMIGKEELAKMKDGVIIVNTANREIINEEAMAEAIKTEKVYGYAYEAENLESGPLVGLENAVGIKGFGWFTKEALERLMEIWVGNIEAIAHNKPINVVNK